MENSSGGLNGFAVGMVIFVLFAIVACGAMLTSSVQSPSATPDPYRATYTAQANERLMMQAGQTATVAAFDRSAAATEAGLSALYARQTSEVVQAAWTEEAAQKTAVSARATEAQVEVYRQETLTVARITEDARAREAEYARQLAEHNLASTETSARYTQTADQTQTALNIQIQQANISAQSTITAAEAYKAEAAAERIKFTNEIAGWGPWVFGTFFVAVIIAIAVWVFSRLTNTVPHYADNKGALPVFTDRNGRVIVPEASGHPVIDPNNPTNLPDDLALRLGLAGKGVAGIRALPAGMGNAARKGVRELTQPTEPQAQGDYKMLQPGDIKSGDMEVLDARWRDVDE